MRAALTSADAAERQAIEQLAASLPGGPSDAWYEAIAELATAADRRSVSYAEACRGIYGPRSPGLRDVERAAIRAEGSIALRPKILRAGPAQPPGQATPRKDRKFCNPPPPTAQSLGKAATLAGPSDAVSAPWAPRDRPGGWVDPRRVSWALTEAVRPLGQARQVWCRRALLAGAAGLEGHKGGRLAWTGAETCSSLWACPTCSWRIRAHRGVELSELVRVIRDTTPQTETGLESRAGTGGIMLTLTLRHRWPDDLTELRRLLTRSWSRFIRGRPFEKFKAATGLVGFVRSIEVTHGKRGWHPHLHAMLSGDPGWNLRRYAGQTAETWMRRRWLACVRKEGERDGSKGSHVPSWNHALKLSPIRPGYLEKMGLELVLATEKRGAHGNRTPWQIADDWRRTRRKRSARLWKTYAASMKGCKFLTWSRALRRWVGLGASVNDSVVAADRGQPVGSLPAPAWRAIRDATDWTTGRPVLVRALEIGERLGARRALQYCWREAGPRMRREGQHGKHEQRAERRRSTERGERIREDAGPWATEAKTASGTVQEMRQANQVRTRPSDTVSHSGKCDAEDRSAVRRLSEGRGTEGAGGAQCEGLGARHHRPDHRTDHQQRHGMDGRPERKASDFGAAMLAAVFDARDRASCDSLPELRGTHDADGNRLSL